MHPTSFESGVSSSGTQSFEEVATDGGAFSSYDYSVTGTLQSLARRSRGAAGGDSTATEADPGAREGGSVARQGVLAPREPVPDAT
jgi:hypothetical protein